MPDKIIFSLLVWVVVSNINPVFAQQDPILSQYSFNQLAINPSYAGIHDVSNVTLNSRFQWGGLEGSPNTQFFTASTSIVGGKVGLGLFLLRDELGIDRNTEAHISYAYKIKNGDKVFSFGLQTGIINKKQDFSALTLKVPDDPFFTPTGETNTKVNFGAGVSYMTNTYFIGFSAPRLINSKFENGTASTTYNRHYYLSGAYLFELQRGIKLKPSVLLKAVSGAPISADINFSVLLNNQFWVGAFTRNFNTIGGMVQWEFMNAYKLGYSFETVGKNLTASSLSTHEVMLSFDFALFGHQSVFQRYF